MNWLRKLFVCALSMVILLIGINSIFAGGKTESGKETSGKDGGKQYTAVIKAGTFALSGRIAKKIAEGQKLIIRNSTLDPACPYSKDVRRGMELAEKEFGIDYKMIGPADAVLEKQIEELETIIKSESVDGLVIASGDEATMQPIFSLAWERGIPVTTYDVDTAGSKRLAYVGSMNMDVGRANAEAFIKLHPKKTGKLVLFACHSEGIYARERIAGFLEILKRDNYQMTIIGPFSTGIDMNEAYGVVENALLSNPDTDSIYVPDEFVVIPAEYEKRNNLKGKMIIIGVNDFPDILKYVKDGYIQQVIGNSPSGQGYLGAKIIYEFITKGKTTDEMMLVKLDSITKENVDKYLATAQ